MRKISLLLVLISVAIVSCKKEHKPVQPVSSTQKVTFTVGFSQTTQAINSGKLVANALNVNSTPDTSLTNHINIIYYSVFDSAGNLLHNVYQTSSDTSFGHYTDNLHAGTYTVTISAGTNIGVSGGGTDLLSNAFIYGPGGVNSSQGFVSDVFFKRISVTVGNNAVTSAVALNRLTSRLIVNINDAIPANSNYAKITISNVASRYYVGDDHIINVNGVGNNGGTYNYTIPASAAGTLNYRIVTDFMYLADFDAGIEVGQTTNQVTTVYGSKAVPNVTAVPNMITLLSGSLFGGTGTHSTGGFQVATDTSWNTPIVKTF